MHLAINNEEDEDEIENEDEIAKNDEK